MLYAFHFLLLQGACNMLMTLYHLKIMGSIFCGYGNCYQVLLFIRRGLVALGKAQVEMHATVTVSVRKLCGNMSERNQM